MTWLNSQFTIADAAARGLDVWELYISNWGNASSPSADGTSRSFPALNTAALPSVAGVAIGPMSTVDRCMIAYDLQKIVPAQATWDYSRRVTQNAPLLFLQPGDQQKITALTPGIGGGTLVVYNELSATPVPNDSFVIKSQYRTAAGVLSTFGSTAPDAKWLAPLLHLYFYLRPPAFPPPTKRMPLMYRDSLLAGATPEKLGFQVPVCGRKTIIVGLTSAEAGTYRIALIQHTDGTAAPQEATVASGALVANTRVRVPITPAFGDYLMIYYDVPLGGTNLTAEVYATDD